MRFTLTRFASLLLLGSAGELAVTRIVTLRGRGGRGSVAA